MKLSCATLKGKLVNGYCLAKAFIGNISLLFRFILYPDIWLKSVSMSRIAGMDMVKFEMYNNRSSAYSDTLCSMPFLDMPVIIGLVRKAMAKGSTEMANSSGLRGHPCLVDL